MKKQFGFTLVEVMIAGVIGIFLMTGIINLFITTNKSVGLTDGISQNQEAGRFAMDYLTQFVRSAGYSEDFTKFTPALMRESLNISCSGDAAAACAANNPPGIRGDRLSIPVTASTTTATSSCSGATIGGPGNPSEITNVFWVSDDNDSIRELRCRTWNRADEEWLDSGAVSIVGNIEHMEFQVGVADDADDRHAAKYVNMNSTFTNDLVRSIRISILTTSQDSSKEDKQFSNKSAREYGILDGPSFTITDSNIRNIFTSTIELPNLINTSRGN